MPRNQGSDSDDPFYRRSRAGGDMYADDALPLDDDGDEIEEEPQFRRAGKRVPVRRSALPRKTAARIRVALLIILVLAAVAALAYVARDFALHSARFLVRDESSIELAGEAPNSRAQVLRAMRPVVGHSLFQISLRERKQELERIPWVESATVMRLWPNRLRVAVRERAPVAFVSLGGQISLIDSNGVLMEMPNSGTSYSFPVILGMGDDEPLSTRAARMKIFMRLIRELDGEGSKMQYSRQLSEVDLSDADDVKVTAHGSQGDILLHLGSSEFLPKFMVFLANVQKWQQEHGKLESVDLRFGSQVILKSAELPPLPKPESKPAAKPAASRAAAAGAHGVEKKRK